MRSRRELCTTVVSFQKTGALSVLKAARGRRRQRRGTDLSSCSDFFCTAREQRATRTGFTSTRAFLRSRITWSHLVTRYRNTSSRPVHSIRSNSVCTNEEQYRIYLKFFFLKFFKIEISIENSFFPMIVHGLFLFSNYCILL